MTLLANTDIESQVNRRLSGELARIGGKVNQLYRYQNCRVEELNIEKRRQPKPPLTVVKRLRYSYELLEQEVRFWRKGYRAVRDRKTLVLDMHDVVGYPALYQNYDGCLSSNVIEHSWNTMWFLLNLRWITKPDGTQFHAIPHHAHTFDRDRTPTPLAHFIADFEQMIGTTVQSRNKELAALKQEMHSLTDSAAMHHGHYHVFNEHNTRELVEFMFEDVVVDTIKTAEFSDVLVLFSNRLRPEFERNFNATIERYLTLKP
jgi:hypothetical protein